MHPKKARVPNPKVLAVRVADLDEKDMLLGDDQKFFTEPHYNGYPAILVAWRRSSGLLTAAWRCQAPAALVEAFDAGPSGSSVARSAARIRRDRLDSSMPPCSDGGPACPSRSGALRPRSLSGSADGANPGRDREEPDVTAVQPGRAQRPAG